MCGLTYLCVNQTFLTMATFLNFTLKELCASDIAKKQNIDNFPSFTIAKNLEELTEKLLQPLRTAWNDPIRVNSGYRSKALNDAVKGVQNSVHQDGFAADLYPSNGKIDEFGMFVKDWVTKNNIAFDQLLFEQSGSSKWVHFSLYSSTGTQRRQIQNITVK